MNCAHFSSSVFESRLIFWKGQVHLAVVALSPGPIGISVSQSVGSKNLGVLKPLFLGVQNLGKHSATKCTTPLGCLVILRARNYGVNYGAKLAV